MKKKIAVVDPVGVKGAMECFSLGLLKGLNKIGHESFYFSNYKGHCDGVSCYNYFSSRIKSSFSRNSLTYMIGFLSSLWKIRKNNIEIVYFHVFSSTIIELVYYFLSILFVVKNTTILHDVESFNKVEKSFIKKFIYKHSKEILLLSEYAKEIFLRENSEFKDKVKLVKHGNYRDFVNLQLSQSTARSKLGLNPKFKYILFFGKLKKNKGINLIINSLNQINNSYKIIIAGNIQGYDSSELLRAKKENPEKLILDLDYIKNEKRDLYFNAADILLMPYTEIYMSGVLLMSLTFSKIIIASDLPVFKNILTHNENAFLFKSGDSIDLVKKINYAANLSHNNLNRIKDNIKKLSVSYDWEGLSLSYIDLKN